MRRIRLTVPHASVLLMLLVIINSNSAVTQERTAGLFLNNLTAFHGYTLLPPFNSITTYLIDMEGRRSLLGSDYSSGNSVYFYRIHLKDFVAVRKMVLVE